MLLIKTKITAPPHSAPRHSTQPNPAPSQKPHKILVYFYKLIFLKGLAKISQSSRNKSKVTLRFLRPFCYKILSGRMGAVLKNVKQTEDALFFPFISIDYQGRFLQILARYYKMRSHICTFFSMTGRFKFVITPPYSFSRHVLMIGDIQ